MKKMLFIITLFFFTGCVNTDHRKQCLNMVKKSFPDSIVYQADSTAGMYWYVLDTNNNLIEVTTAYTQSPIITSIRKLTIQK